MKKNNRILKMRRLALKGLLAGDDNPHIIRAETRDELEQAFSLVHEEYLRAGYIKEPNPSKIHFNIHNLLPNSTALVIKYGSQIISTLSVVMDDAVIGLPMDKIYHGELDGLRDQGRKLCEFCALATLGKHRWQKLFMYIFRAMYWHAVNSRMNDICIIVNPKHTPFYKAVLLFEDLGPEKFYSRLGVPAVALRLNLDINKHRLREAYQDIEHECNLYSFIYESRNHFIEDPEPEWGGKSNQFMDGQLARYFLKKRQDIFNNLLPSHIDYMFGSVLAQ